MIRYFRQGVGGYCVYAPAGHQSTSIASDNCLILLPRESHAWEGAFPVIGLWIVVMAVG